MKKTIIVLIVLLSVNMVCALEIKLGETGEMKMYLKNETDNTPVSDANCTVDILFPNNTIYLDDQPMTNNTDGVYNYTFMASSGIPIGNYIAIANCTKGSTNDTSAMMFSVVSSPITEQIGSIKTTVEKTRTIVDNIKDDTNKIPGVRNAVGTLSTQFSSFGFSFNQAFILGLVMLAIIGSGSILSTLYIASNMKKPNEKEENLYF